METLSYQNTSLTLDVYQTDDLRKWHTLGLDIFNENLQNYYNISGNEACRYIPHYAYHDDVI